MLDGAKKDLQSATADGPITARLIDGVKRHEMPNIVTGNGLTTELYRPEWPAGPETIQHIIHVVLRGRAVSAWHVHRNQTDTFFVTSGTLRLVLFDDRDESPSRGEVNQFLLSRMRPGLVTVPPGIWHGLENLEETDTAFINYFDRPYCYEDPDEWRLPADTDKIPYRFG